MATTFFVFYLIMAFGTVFIFAYRGKNFPIASQIWTTAFFVLFITLLVFMIVWKSEPSAMDVYRGRTTLEIVYRDGVPVDSTVVFKDQK